MGGTLTAFADDTAIVFNGKSWQEVMDKATDGMLLVKRWLDRHKLLLNLSKTKYMTFSLTASGLPTDTKMTIHNSNCILQIHVILEL